MTLKSAMFQSAAAKLTVYYLFIVMALSFGCSIALYHVSSMDLGNNARRQVAFFRDALGASDVYNYQQLRQKQLQEDRNHLKANLVLFNLVVLAVGGGISYGLAKRTLLPIEEALEAQTRFSSDASHELRTPLTAMQTEIEVALRDKKLDKKAAVELLQSNLEEVAKLKNLSEGLLRLASQDVGLDKQAVANLPAITSEAIDRISKTASAKKISLQNQTTKLSIRGDHQSLVELLAILLDNAVKYSPSGSEVVLNSGRSGKLAKISIKDNGPGIKASDMPHIFDRFYRSDASRSKQQADGYGLGLAIAKQIAQLHSGSIEVKSLPGQGSTFIVKLPVA